MIAGQQHNNSVGLAKFVRAQDHAIVAVKTHENDRI